MKKPERVYTLSGFFVLDLIALMASFKIKKVIKNYRVTIPSSINR